MNGNRVSVLMMTALTEGVIRQKGMNDRFDSEGDATSSFMPTTQEVTEEVTDKIRNARSLNEYLPKKTKQDETDVMLMEDEVILVIDERTCLLIC